MITNQDGELVSVEFIKEYVPDLNILVVGPPEVVKQSSFVQEDNYLIIRVYIEETAKGNDLELEFSPDESKFSCDFALQLKK